MKTLKVALVIDRFGPEGGGLEKCSHQLALWLANAGHKVHVLAFEFCSGPNIANLYFNPLLKVPDRLGRAAVAEQAIKKMEVDIVHDTGIGWSFDVLQPHMGSRYANYMHDLISMEPLARSRRRFSLFHHKRLRQLRRLEHRQYSGSDGIIIAPSMMVKDHIMKYYGVAESRIRLIYNGVDTNRFNSEYSDKQRKRIRKELGFGSEVLFLFAAHNFRLKGLRTTLKAMQLLSDNNVKAHLAVLGKADAGLYKNIARRLGIREKVTFLGSIAEPSPYFIAGDVLVHPTFYDACSLVVLEALSCGLPAITSRFNGAAELMESGVHGYVINDPGNAYELFEKMKLLTENSIRMRMSECLKSLPLNTSLEKNFSEIEKIYLEVTARD